MIGPLNILALDQGNLYPGKPGRAVEADAPQFESTPVKRFAWMQSSRVWLKQIQEKWTPVFRPDTGGGIPPFLRKNKELEGFCDSTFAKAL